MRNVILNNLGLKILSLVLAVLVWFAIESSLHRKASPSQGLFRRTVTLSDTFAVAVLTPPGGPPAFTVKPAEVTVRFSADAVALRRFDTNEVQVFVNLTEAPNPLGQFAVEVKLPPEIHLLDVNPATVFVAPLKTNSPIHLPNL